MNIYTFFSYIKKTRYQIAIGFDVLCILVILVYGIGVHANIISPLSSASPLSGLLNLQRPTSASHITLGNGITVSLPDLQGLSTKNMRYKSHIITSAKDFMNMPPSDERAKKEIALMRYLTSNNASAADTLLALQATATRPSRAWGMEHLWQLRQNGALAEFHIYPFDQKKIQWAREHDIDPRILAIATDIYGPTTKVLTAKPELFFEASSLKQTSGSDIYKYVPSPAVVARLQMTETGWGFDGVESELEDLNVSWDFPKQGHEDRAFINIGTVTAWDALNLSEEWFPSGHDDLRWIAAKLESSSGLPYSRNVYSLPGSIRGSGDGSGGAIGPQLMPINARLFMTWYDNANQELNYELPPANPFNPWTGTLLTYLYLSSEFYHRQLHINNVTDVVRPGYAILEKSNQDAAYHPRLDPRIRALLKWNPLYWQAKTAIEAGEKYNDIWLKQDVAYGKF